MAFTHPRENVAHLGLREGEIVADFGSGTGAFIFPAADKVGNTGKVIAIDVQKDILSNIAKEALNGGYKNVETLWGDLEERGGSKLSDKTVNAVIVSNVLFQLDDRDKFLDEISRVLKENGRVLVIDWTGSFSNLGPTPEMIFNEEKARTIFKSYGYSVLDSFEAGDHHYGLVFKKEK